jgi:hypothetical protein
MENEHFVFQEMEDLSISQTMDQYLPGGVFNLDSPMCDEKFDLNEVDHSRFVKSVSDEELKSLVENQENVNTKNNTKWAINVLFKSNFSSHIGQFKLKTPPGRYWSIV